MIPYGRQEVTQADIDAVVTVLKSEYLTQGQMVPRFEDALAARVGARYAVAFNSATSALHAACLAMDLGPGDELWTSPNTFVASANCARYCGAGVEFVDIDRDTWNMSTARLRELLVRRPTPKIVVPVHFAGQPTEQERIWELSREFGFRVLEDASHAIGARRNGEPVGSCRWSDITVMSFHPVKIITSGEGGMALTNSAQLAERLRLIRSHGISRDPSKFQDCGGLRGEDGSFPAWYYEQQTLGFNYRMTDIHAALGLSQLDRVDQYVERRNELAGRYSSALQGVALQLPRVRAENYSAMHLYAVRLIGPRDVRRHRQVFEALRGAGIGVNLHYAPVHLQPYYRALGFMSGHCPEAEAHGASAITLPLYPGLHESDQDRVIDTLKSALGHG